MGELTAASWPSPLHPTAFVCPPFFLQTFTVLSGQRKASRKPSTVPLVQLPEVLKFLLWHLGQATDGGGRDFLHLAEKHLKILTQHGVWRGKGKPYGDLR